MGSYVSNQLVKLMQKKSINIISSRVLIMGLTFKEDCPDTRNTKVIDIIHDLTELGLKVDCYDPLVNANEVKKTHNINQVIFPQENTYDAILIAVSHQKFIELGVNQIKAFGKAIHVLYDLKYVFSKSETDLRL